MRVKLFGIVLSAFFVTPLVAGASTFIGTDIEDPGSSARMRILERTLEHGKVMTQNAREHLHELGLSQRSKLIRKLQQGGIRVILLGDKVRIVIPSMAFLEPGTTMIKPDKAEVLAHLYSFIAAYPATAIRVVGHSDNLGEEKQKKRFSTQIARVIAGYLWANGIAQNHISIHGVGAEEPVTDSYTGSLNSRVEILFQNKNA